VLASKPIRVAGCVFGIVGSLILYGLLQERIMYAPPQHHPILPCMHCHVHPLHTPLLAGETLDAPAFEPIHD
jgi:hypothetical protein